MKIKKKEKTSTKCIGLLLFMNLYSSLICDIPAFYSQWLCNRFDKGYFIKCQDGNKYIRYSLNNIEKMTLISRNFSKIVNFFPTILNHCSVVEIIQELSFYEYFYQNIHEDNKKPLKAFRALSRRTGKKHMAFSYGPIIKTNEITLESHKQNLQMICDIIGNLCSKIYLDYNVNMESCGGRSPYGEFSEEEKVELYKYAKEIFAAKKVAILKKPQISELTHNSIDMGELNMCQSGCRICQGINRNLQKSCIIAMHNPLSPMLIGTVPDNLKTVDFKEIQDSNSTENIEQITL